ncbi:piggyBac transposable element-derived protein 3-like [Hydractinia symbiolongicarpus]|uniref:piggyBac transposable element-derived protein 3-like n=1 Tax=Hydractinia symbiolongicarpus TaxID=13093 RepID=UPI00254B6E36|nr:piggyBac transposable element-derived protein 3-like [Hydractinia symbiolongicarpus]
MSKTNEQASDKLFKIQPLWKMVLDNCIKVEPKENHSIDEQIIPAKTRTSAIRQYNPKKPQKWVSRCWYEQVRVVLSTNFSCILAQKHGIGETAANVVMKLCKGLLKHVNHKLSFENWFSILELLVNLKQLQILVTCNIRSNRVANCPLMLEKDLRKLGRGPHDYRKDANFGIIIDRWYDKKSVQLASTYAIASVSSQVQRFLKKKTRELIPWPGIVKEYNSAMEGVDLADMLIALYCSPYKIKCWYLKVVFHRVDICKVNSWLLYRRYADQLKIPKKGEKCVYDSS